MDQETKFKRSHAWQYDVETKWSFLNMFQEEEEKRREDCCLTIAGCNHQPPTWVINTLKPAAQ